MINTLKKLLLIYDLKPFNEKNNTFFVKYENDIYIFFRNFFFLGNLSSLDFFHAYMRYVKNKYSLCLNAFQTLFLLINFSENLNFDRTCCIKKNTKFK